MRRLNSGIVSLFSVNEVNAHTDTHTPYKIVIIYKNNMLALKSLNDYYMTIRS